MPTLFHLPCSNALHQLAGDAQHFPRQFDHHCSRRVLVLKELADALLAGAAVS
jgi:hypothetical protein